jgi:hypothetical protein
MSQNIPLLLALTLIGLLNITTVACNLGKPQQRTAENLRTIDEETSLAELADIRRVLVVVDAYSGREGVYWLDLDNHHLYLARRPQALSLTDGRPYNWTPEAGMSVWAGDTFVYGSRVNGFFSLAPDGTEQH